MNFHKTLTIAVAMTATASAMANTLDPNNPSGTVVDRFADIKVMRYVVPGRDILWDQNGKYNLPIRQLLESVYTNYTGDRSSEEFRNFELYLKQVEFGNGVYHHYSTDKFTPRFSQKWFDAQVSALEKADRLPVNKSQLPVLAKVIFDSSFMPKRVNQAAGQDLITTSAVNMYENITQPEVEAYYAALKDTTDLTPVSYGLNSRLVKDADGNITELHCTYDPDSRSGMPGASRKVKGTLHWVSAAHAVDATARVYDRLFNVENPSAEEGDFRDLLNPDSLKVIEGVKVEPFIAENARRGEKFQFQRIGYFTPDYDSTPGNLIFNRTIALKDSWEKVQKKNV